ncbi:hypothetical protein [uncultured Sphingomonas sp.]|uniref:hypothetical protein n=1 Tax=uncultured Sphingomonas sp. TaxID=158754 RepID=UPI003749FC89
MSIPPSAQFRSRRRGSRSPAALGDITLESMARRIQRGMVEGVYPATATYDIAN